MASKALVPLAKAAVPFKWVGEQFTSFLNYDISRGTFFSNTFSRLRSFAQSAFFHRPVMEGTVLDYDLARSLYRNDNPEYVYGAGFVKPVIDRMVEYIGLPSVSSESGDTDSFLNECIRDYWAPQILQVYREAMRDSKVIVRYYQPRIDNPLFTESDRTHGTIQVIPPEIVQLVFDPVDPNLVIRAVITHFYLFDQRTEREIALGVMPRMYTHEIMEIIEPNQYTYYDKTAGMNLENWTVKNTWGFVPVWPVWNEYASDLGGGLSDIEPMMTFIKAFHDVMEQTLTSHKYHSSPKVVFNIKDVSQFLKNNWPDAVDEVGRPLPGAKIKLSGREIYFMAPEEKAGFVEAKSVLGDSKTLLLFLLDCISIAAETPKWALMIDDTANEQSASIQAFEKKVMRKRTNFSEFIVMICKMALVANGKTPDTPRFAWPHIRLDDLASKAQSVQQIILGLDAASQHHWVSDTTAIKILGTIFPEINDPDVEMQNAAANYEPPVALPAPQSSTQALPPAPPKKSTAKKPGITTTKASAS
jgi:hypothetical protein